MLLILSMHYITVAVPLKYYKIRFYFKLNWNYLLRYLYMFLPCFLMKYCLLKVLLCNNKIFKWKFKLTYLTIYNFFSGHISHFLASPVLHSIRHDLLDLLRLFDGMHHPDRCHDRVQLRHFQKWSSKTNNDDNNNNSSSSSGKFFRKSLLRVQSKRRRQSHGGKTVYKDKTDKGTENWKLL